MEQFTFEHKGLSLPAYRCGAAVVGTGAGGFAAAGHLHAAGVDVLQITEGYYMGTSRNTGSDKQTYYKLGLGGDAADSVQSLAQTLFDGGCMDGPAAVVQAALSARSFYHLVELGVPFPHNEYGEYVGYKTDHDPARRATSCGPLTSNLMTQALQADCQRRGIPVLDDAQAVALLVADGRVGGLLLWNQKAAKDSPVDGFRLVFTPYVIWATGGPAGLYQASVYPPSQFGGSGAPLEAGASGINLTEWQYGIASTKFRWNLSGTYQQVLPRYVSTDADGNDPREFLFEGFDSPTAELDAEFLKGYQWPFDASRVQASSRVDMLVYRERQHRGRRVFMDFRRNPSALEKDGRVDFSVLGDEAREYLTRSQALLDTPIARLAHMNPQAIELYASNGIDLNTEMLEIDVCAQHQNGGLYGDAWRQSNLAGLFPIGECGGTFGVRRPGGSALNDTQVGALRASQWIAAQIAKDGQGCPTPQQLEQTWQAPAARLVDCWMNRARKIAGRTQGSGVLASCAARQAGMTTYAAQIRNPQGIRTLLQTAKEELKAFDDTAFLDGCATLADAWRTRDRLISEIAALTAMQGYMANNGGSRGGYLVQPEVLPEGEWGFTAGVTGQNLEGQVQTVTLDPQDPTQATVAWRPVQPLPQREDWFELVWAAYRADGGVRPIVTE